MKKYILLLATILMAFSACDYNERNFEGFEDLSKPKNQTSYEYAFKESDVSTIVKALNANKTRKDSLTAKIFNADKMFSIAAPASELMPYLLTTLYYAADVKSSAKVTYPYKEGRNATVIGLSTPPYTVTDDDYKLIWGDNYVTAFTPSKSPETSIPVILAKNVASPVEGMYKNVEYYYSAEEPVTTIVKQEILKEDFEAYPAGSGVLVAIDGWINKDLTGSIGWQNRILSDNKYAQVSSNKSGAVNDVRLITKEINLTGTSNPKFTFDLAVGYFTANCLSVEISENFDGNAANISSATWKNVTSSFTIPQQPATGYSAWANAGVLDLKTYKGKRVYISFKYSGDDTSTPKKTTTYQIDNVKAYDEITGQNVKSKQLQYAAYTYTNSKWQAATSVVSIQPADYDAMGLKFLTTAQAPSYLPAYLKLKFPFAQERSTKTVVYKTTATTCYADEYVYTAGTWTPNSFVEQRTEQFVYSNTGWVFDPTLRVTMQKGKNDTDDYMMIVNYVKAHQAVQNPALINSYGDSEYYYGFSANYGNVSYRDKDRSLDTTYPKTGTVAEKAAFMDQRTIDAIKLYLTMKFPNAQPQVKGLDQMAEITVLIYSNPVSSNTNENWTYTFQCTGTKDWKYIQRVSQFGTIEKAK